MSGILGTLIVLGVCAYLGFYLWQASWDNGPDAQKIYDDLILRDYEQDARSGEVQPASDQDEGTGSTDQEAGER